MQSGTAARIRKEIAMLNDDPPPGVVFFPIDDSNDSEIEILNKFEAQITGPAETPYSQGIFRLEVLVPPRYPFEPPKVRFVTPIYHPNIDDGGRICLDTLKMQPQGSWSPSVNMSTLLTSIRLLMAHPNPDDGLMADITEIYRNDHAKFEATAKKMTKQHASQEPPSSSSSSASSSSMVPPGVSISKDSKPLVVIDNDDDEDEDSDDDEDREENDKEDHKTVDNESKDNDDDDDDQVDGRNDSEEYEDEYEDEYIDDEESDHEIEITKRQKVE